MKTNLGMDQGTTNELFKGQGSSFKFVREVSTTEKENLLLKVGMNLSFVTLGIIRSDKDIICLH